MCLTVDKLKSLLINLLSDDNKKADINMGQHAKKGFAVYRVLINNQDKRQ